jgi:hypothetical protein
MEMQDAPDFTLQTWLYNMEGAKSYQFNFNKVILCASYY